MSNQFLDLVSSPLMNLDHTYRYSGTKLVEAESLSQHIVDTIMMGLKIIDEINYIANYRMIDPATYLIKAVCHDLEEVITGDIPRPLKYYNEQTLSSMKDVADKVAKEFFDSQFHSSESYYAVWDRAKSGNEGYILKIVDTLVVASKVVKEVTLLNNMYMLKVAHEVSSYLIELRESTNRNARFLGPVQDYILGLIDGAIRAMEDILEEHSSCLRNLNIYRQSMI